MILLQPQHIFNRALALARYVECYEHIMEWVEKFYVAGIITLSEHNTIIKTCKKNKKNCSDCTLHSWTLNARNKWFIQHYNNHMENINE